MKVALIGNGKMGKMLASLCTPESGFEVVGMVGPGDAASLAEIPEAELAFDFSYPGNLRSMLTEAIRRQMPLVIGTTGLNAEEQQLIRDAARQIPIVWADSFSTGVTVLIRLVRQAAKALGDDFDIEVVETHHRQKVDAPSGTAKALLKAIDPEGKHELVHGREGHTGARGREIGVHALRGGTVAGDHSVKFFGYMEELELHHRSDSREIFAKGALRAAEFAKQAPVGLYDMEDVLFGGH